MFLKKKMDNTYFYSENTVTTVQNNVVHKSVSKNDNGKITKYNETIDLNVSHPQNPQSKKKHIRWKDIWCVWAKYTYVEEELEMSLFPFVCSFDLKTF